MDRIDRSRLQQVQQTDLTESKINEDFLYWLKNSGPTWLLGALAVLTVILLYNRWTEHRSKQVDSAWSSLAAVQNGLPASLVDVANDSNTSRAGAVRHLARLQAADTYLRAVQTGQPVSAQDSTTKLSDEDRSHYLDQAGQLYEQVAKETRDDPALTILTVNALMGSAAVQESKGDAAQAKSLYEQAAEHAGKMYPHLADDAKQRAASASRFDQLVRLPSSMDLQQSLGPSSTRQSADIDPAVLGLIRGSSMLP